MLNSSYYYEAKVKDQIVVDIGGFIGDNAVFFSARGAKAVYVYEPSKESFKYLTENIKKYSNIYAFNYGLGCKDHVSYLAGEGMGKHVSENGEEVIIKDINSILKSIIEEHKEIGLLKIDCEGCEFEIIRCLDPKIIHKIKQIYIEIHGKNQKYLLKYLKSFGFKIFNKYKIRKDIYLYFLK